MLPPFWSYSSVTMSLQWIRVCAAVQVSPILRIPPPNSRNLMEASFTTRTRRAPAASRWHSSHTGMSLPWTKTSIKTCPFRTVTARPDAHSRLERRAAPAGRHVRTAQPTSCVLGVIYTGDACAQLASAGLRLESRRWWHMYAYHANRAIRSRLRTQNRLLLQLVTML